MTIYHSKNYTFTIDNRRYLTGLKMLKLIRLLCGAGLTMNQLGEKMDMSTKTVRRMVMALESDNVPVIVDGQGGNGHPKIYSMDRQWIRQFFRVEV